MHLDFWSQTFGCYRLNLLFLSPLSLRSRQWTARLSTSTWPTWSWSPCCCSRRWTCRSSRPPPSSRRRSCTNARPSWERSSYRSETWRTTSIISCCGSWSRRPRCCKCALDTSDDRVGVCLACDPLERCFLGCYSRMGIIVLEAIQEVLHTVWSHNHPGLLTANNCLVDVDTILPNMHAGYYPRFGT